MRDEVDLAIVGAGPAGLSAAIEAVRSGVSHRIFSEEEPGGLIRAAGVVENCALLNGVKGIEIAKTLCENAVRKGIQLIYSRVIDIKKTGSLFFLKLESGESYFSKAVILATGTTPRHANFPIYHKNKNGTEDRIFYDTRAMNEDLRNVRVIISGGGEIAFDSALSVSLRGAVTTVVMRSSKPRTNSGLSERVASASISIHPESVITSARVLTDSVVICVKDSTGKDCEFEADYLLVCHGREPKLELYENLVGDEKEVKGVFLAGDVINKDMRYLTLAMGQGTRAAIEAEKYIKEV